MIEKIIDGKNITDKIYQQAIDKYGKESQICMAVEEVGELITAINQYKRCRIEKISVCEEIADVQIMMEQLSLIYGKDDVEKEKERKILRLKERLNKID